MSGANGLIPFGGIRKISIRAVRLRSVISVQIVLILGETYSYRNTFITLAASVVVP